MNETINELSQILIKALTNKTKMKYFLKNVFDLDDNIKVLAITRKNSIDSLNGFIEINHHLFKFSTTLFQINDIVKITVELARGNDFIRAQFEVNLVLFNNENSICLLDPVTNDYDFCTEVK
ncbi:hypothetical protein SBRV1_gp06 [Sulfolobales Beppu rod-shaped virus 1]|uniref:Uncharacterized protein n=1 Tax=Sulfolobales Beppu rod-shaped virus 1 TaxID=2493121 RepID=A0A3Q8Q3X4_9VIRU|nr:hypothetical protein QIT32_gp06 [Sulfolobales Beppu rod-shaped virus 1]AZI75895.1 hypothetical protein SBRV1_gp06 [Sulfolobales Beppu rod-shaped virus 1]